MENGKKTATKSGGKKSGGPIKPHPEQALGGPVLLSGGNPQIPKGYGEEPVQAYIAAMPGWKSAVGKRLDEIITETVPHVEKAVKWNTPMYGVGEGTYFIGFHCFDKYIKVAFFRGDQLDPLPPVSSKSGVARYYHIKETDQLDEAQFADWVQQASQKPGEKM